MLEEMDNAYPKTADWESIPGCAGYEASTDGQIRRSRNGRIKSQRKAASGHFVVDIGKSTRRVPDLVARAFHGHPTSRGFRVKHVNGDLSDNRAENLTWSGFTIVDTRPEQGPTVSTVFEAEYYRVVDARREIEALMQPGGFDD